MSCCVSNIAEAHGHNGRWLRACSCCSELKLSVVRPKQKRGQDHVGDAADGKPCVFGGRRAADMAHRAPLQMAQNVLDASSPSYVAALVVLPERVQGKVLRFETHVKHRAAESLKAKYAFWGLLPHLLCGLLGMLSGYSVEACAEVARKMQQLWDAAVDKRGVHRVAVQLFTTEVLLYQFNQFKEHPQCLTAFLDLFVFVLKY